MTTDLRQAEGAENLFLTTESAEADEVVCLYAPEFFYAVGQFFEDFSQVSDEQAIALLRQSDAQPTPKASATLSKVRRDACDLL
jgi:predicted phosphoribosyltransferase